VELEAELVWASGPLLEENEQLTGANEALRTQLHSASVELQSVKSQLAEAEKKLGYVLPVSVVAAALAALAIWAFSGSKQQ
jgi:uncharacterized membrane protein